LGEEYRSLISSLRSILPSPESSIIIIIIIIIGATGIVTRKEKFGSYTKKTLDRFTTKDSYTWNITHNTESTTV
jgi:hypothetical protein